MPVPFKFFFVQLLGLTLGSCEEGTCSAIRLPPSIRDIDLHVDIRSHVLKSVWKHEQ